MSQATLSDRNLSMQGFPIQQDSSFQRIRPWLRFTPSLSTLWIATGTALASPTALFTFSLISAVGASQNKHPFDHLYEHAIMPFTHGEPLPDNPPPRRFAMALASAEAISAASLLATGHRKAGIVTGAVLTFSAATVALTNFCLGSWIYRKVKPAGYQSRKARF
jgi:hypothetical protein